MFDSESYPAPKRLIPDPDPVRATLQMLNSDSCKLLFNFSFLTTII